MPMRGHSRGGLSVEGGHAMKKSKNRKRVRVKKQPHTPTVKKTRRMPPLPFYAGKDALDYRLPGSFESNQ
jgi:hypothetical protein